MHGIQRILGHAQISTTRIYTDPTDSLTRDAADRMGRALWPEEQPPTGLSADEARDAAALSEPLASGDPDRIKQALRGLREGRGKCNGPMTTGRRKGENPHFSTGAPPGT
jgi:hypothetical protein